MSSTTFCAGATPQFVITDLGTLGGDTSIALGLNDTGQVVGQASNGCFGQAFLYQNGGIINLLPNSAYSAASDINNVGQVVGAEGSIGFVRQSDGSIVPIINTIGGSTSTALAINDGGQVVGAAGNGSFQHAFLYQNGVMTDLFPGDVTSSVAYDINTIGQIVGSSTEAFLAWRDASGNIAFTSLDSRLDLSSPGWNLSDARAINAFGQIVGVGINPSGQSRAFLATPTGTLNWTTGSGNWDDPANWELGFLPNKFLDPVIATNQGDVTVNGPAADTTLMNITVGGGTGGTLLELTTGSNLTVTESILISGPSGGDRLIQSAGSVSVQSLTVGQAGGQGSFVLTGGGSLLTTFNENIGLGGVGTFIQADGTHTVGDTLLIGSSAQGMAGSATYVLQGGNLTTVNEIVGGGADGTGTFTQTGGTHTVSNALYIGSSVQGVGVGGNGTYELIGGSLDAGDVIIANIDGATGSFVQTGGAVSVSNRLLVGTSVTGLDPLGLYAFRGGTVNAREVIVGDGVGGVGAFTQTGGTHTVGDVLTIGRVGGQGTYELSGDDSLLTAASAFIGRGGGGSFTQSGGTHTVGETLVIGSSTKGFDANGTYTLIRGNLNTVTNEIIGDGDGGFGTFVQTGGTHTVSGTLTIGQFGGRGSYALSDGTLMASNENLGINGAQGTFLQAGGNHTVIDTLTISRTGAYTLSGGSLSSANTLNNGRFVQSGGTISGVASTGIGLINNGSYDYSGGTFTGSLINNGTAIFGPLDRSVFGADISGTGNLSKVGNATLILTGTNTYAGGTTVLAGVLQGDTNSLQGDITNNATVVFDQANTGTYTGSIRGDGNVVKENTGLLVFNNSNTYRGGTQINNGNLQVGDAAHPDASLFGLVNIGPNGVLSGHGTIDGNVDNAGRIAPGGSIGTLTVNGNVAFQNGSAFQTAIDPNQSSLLDVKGLANLGDAQVAVLAENGRYGPRRYTILSASAISGRFLDALDSNLASIDPLLTPSLAYDSNNVYLDLNSVPLQDPMGPGARVATNLIYMINRMATGRLNAPLGEGCPPASLGFWGRGLGMFSSVNASGDSPGYSADTAGFVLGVDGQLTERLALGISGFSAHSDVTTNSTFRNRSAVNTAGISLYGAYTTGAWQLKSVLGYANETYTSQQTITAGQPRRAQGSTEGNRVSNYTEGSYTFRSGIVSLQPLVALQLGWMQQDPFTQKGLFADGQGLTVSGRTLYQLDTLVGARARQDFPMNESLKLQVELRALYLHQFGTLQNTVPGQLSGGQTVSLGTADRPGERDAGILGAGLALLAVENVNFYFDYNAQVLSSQTAHFFSGGIRYAW
ncbi:MAG: autotransporter domain-containing protein [Methylotetracoccus sp.]|nr:autotransporter domain-containing protein [Methylotetracoccus sp.]